MNIKIEWTCIEKAYSVRRNGENYNPQHKSNQIEYESITEILEAIQEAGWPICQYCGQDLDFSVGVSNI